VKKLIFNTGCVKPKFAAIAQVMILFLGKVL